VEGVALVVVFGIVDVVRVLGSGGVYLGDFALGPDFDVLLRLLFRFLYFSKACVCVELEAGKAHFGLRCEGGVVAVVVIQYDGAGIRTCRFARWNASQGRRTFGARSCLSLLHQLRNAAINVIALLLPSFFVIVVVFFGHGVEK